MPYIYENRGINGLKKDLDLMLNGYGSSQVSEASDAAGWGDEERVRRALE